MKWLLISSLFFAQFSFGGPQAVTYPFDKRLSFYAFEKIAKVPTLERMISLAIEDGVDVFDVEKESISPPPLEILKEWKEMVEREKSNGHPLYASFFRKDYPFPNYEAKRDLIVISGKIDRLIFLHEYSHYLINKERVKSKNYQTIAAVNLEKLRSSQNFFSLASATSKPDPKRMDQAGLRLAKAIRESLCNSSIEEAVVDYLILESIRQKIIPSKDTEISLYKAHATENIDLAKRPLVALQNTMNQFKNLPFKQTRTNVKNTLDELAKLQKRI